MSTPIRKCLLFMVCGLVALAAQASPFAYIADDGASRVTVVAFNPAGTRAYVSNDFAGSIEVIDTATNTIVATIPSAGLLGLAVNSAGTQVYSAFGGSGKVIDTATNTVVATITFPVVG